MHKLTSSQLTLPQAQLNLEGCDVYVQVCHENVFSLQFHVEAVQVRSDVREQGKASKPLWVGEVISMGKVLLTEEGADFLLQVAHAGQHGPATQPADFTKVEQVAVVGIDLVHQCLELAVVEAAGKYGVDDLHHDRHDVDKIGRLGAQRFLVDDAVHLVDGLRVSSCLTVAH